MILFGVVVGSVIICLFLSIMSSFYTCYAVPIDQENPNPAVLTFCAVLLINILVPYVLGVVTGLWYIS